MKTTRKFIIFVLLLTALSSCGKPDKVGSANSGSKSFELICIDNVEYIAKTNPLYYQGYIAPHYYPNGDLYTCE